MARKFNSLIVLGVITTFILCMGLPAGAQTEGIRAQQAEIASVQEQLRQLRSASSLSYENYNGALAQLEALEAKIETANERLASAEEDYERAQASFQERATQVYRSGNVGFMDVLMGAEDFSEFSSRVELWLRLLRAERTEMENMQTAREELSAARDELTASRDERAATVERADAQRTAAEQSEGEAEAYLSSLDGELRSMLQAEERRKAEEIIAAARAELERIAREQAAVAAAAEAPEETVAAQPAAETTPAAENADREAAAQAEERERLQAEREAAERAAREQAEQEQLQAELEAQEQAQREQYEQEMAQLEAELSAQGQYEDQQAGEAQYEQPATSANGTGEAQYEQPAASGGSSTADSTDAGGSTGGSSGGGTTGGSCGDTFGGVQPHVAEVGCTLKAKFGYPIYGLRSGDPGDHGSGLALDVMASGAAGQEVADYVAANADAFGVSYIMYNDQFYSTFDNYNGPAYTWVYWGDGAHYDHVHISFNP